MSILNKVVSYFPNKTTTHGVEVNLLTLLQSDKHKDKILRLREEKDTTVQKALKDELAGYTVTGTFSQRNNSGLLISSGLAAVDLDGAEDYDIPYVLPQLKKIPSIAYAGLSCRGFRLFCIVPFKYPDKYEKHYEELIKAFERMGLPMGDSCHKTLSQLRYVSWNDDTTQFFKHDAPTFDLLPPERTFHVLSPFIPRAGYRRPPQNIFQWCVEQINKSYSFSEGTRHSYIVHLARYCNIKGLPENETKRNCLQFVHQDFPEREITDIVHSIYKSQTDSHGKRPFK